MKVVQNILKMKHVYAIDIEMKTKKDKNNIYKKTGKSIIIMKVYQLNLVNLKSIAIITLN